MSQAKLIRRYTHDVYIAYDGDDAGVKAAIRNAQIIEQQDLNAFIIEMPEDEDPDSYILNQGSKKFEKLLDERLIPIQFQIRQFLKTFPHPTIEQKEIFIKEILENLSELKNQVKIGLYIHQISERMQINESLLIGQLNRIKKSKRKYKYSVQQPVENNTVNKPLQMRKGMFDAEAGIIGLLLNMNPEIRNYINENVTYDLFENQSLLEIYEQIMQEIEENGIFSLEQLIAMYQEDEDKKSIISEIVLTQESQSMKFAKDCIFQLKKWHLEKKARELSEMIREEEGSQDSVLHYSQELVQIRREINQLEKNWRNHVPN